MVHRIPYRDTHRFADVVLDHLDDAPALRELRTFPPSWEGLDATAKDRTFPPEHRATLVEALRCQYAGLELGEAVEANLAKLADPRSLTVTTGHQLVLFGGPLYVPFKLLNVVRLARDLEARWDRPVVPVFWMASEDHDRPEIDHTWVNGKRITWPGATAGAVGKLRLDGIDPVLQELEAALGPGSGPLVERLKAHYAPGHDLARATRGLVHDLFGHLGIVVLDGDDPALKQLFAPVMENELVNGVVKPAVDYADERLQQHYKVQAHARAINLFHLRPGHRARIERDGDLYRVLEGGPVFTLDELLQELRKRPEQFSPNVLMRPVYQETILPNVAYVGGGGELAYWLQLRWVFQALQVPMPVVLLRSSALLAGEKDLASLGKMELSVEDLFTDTDALRTRVAKEGVDFSTSLDDELARLDALMQDLETRAAAVDPTLAASARGHAARARKAVEGLQRKYERAARRKASERLERLDRVLEHLFPGGGLQERKENVLPWYLAEGDALWERLLEALDPLNGQFTILGADPAPAG